MSDRKRVLVLSILIMTCIALVVGAISLLRLYRTAFEQQRERLVETVRSRVRGVRAVLANLPVGKGLGHEGS